MKTDRNKRLKRLEPVSYSISRIYKKNTKKNNVDFISLMKNWGDIVSLDYAKILTPLKSSGRTLFVLSSRNFALESDYVAPMLLEKINMFYGSNVFNKIKFTFSDNLETVSLEDDVKLDSKTLDNIEKSVSKVKDDSLKQVLSNLARSMAKQNKKGE